MSGIVTGSIKRIKCNTRRNFVFISYSLINRNSVFSVSSVICLCRFVKSLPYDGRHRTPPYYVRSPWPVEELPEGLAKSRVCGGSWSLRWCQWQCDQKLDKGQIHFAFLYSSTYCQCFLCIVSYVTFYFLLAILNIISRARNRRTRTLSNI